MAKLPLPMVVLLWSIFRLWAAANAQNMNAPSCNASTNYQWADNSLAQNPCLVATYLGQACNIAYSIQSLNASNQFYAGPSVELSDPCRCSSVMYILLSACGACQGGIYPTWSAYNVNCSTVYPAIYPQIIPAATRIPRWAFQNVTTENDFNPIEAQAVGDQPESTGITASTGTTSPGPSPTTTMTGATHKKSDAGAIAGGVVGGFIAVCGLVVAAAYWRRGRSGRRRISPSMVNIDEKPRPFAISNSSVLPSSHTGPGFHASVPSMPVPSTGHKLYNPNDPSTFPSSAQSRSGHSAQSSESKNAVYYQSMSPKRRPVAPEIQ